MVIGGTVKPGGFLFIDSFLKNIDRYSGGFHAAQSVSTINREVVRNLHSFCLPFTSVFVHNFVNKV